MLHAFSPVQTDCLLPFFGVFSALLNQSHMFLCFFSDLHLSPLSLNLLAFLLWLSLRTSKVVVILVDFCLFLFCFLCVFFLMCSHITVNCVHYEHCILLCSSVLSISAAIRGHDFHQHGPLTTFTQINNDKYFQ